MRSGDGTWRPRANAAIVGSSSNGGAGTRHPSPPILGHERVEIDEVGQALRHPIGDGRHDHAAVALTGQDDPVQVFVAEQVEDVLDVRLQPYLRARQVDALGKAGERGGEDLVPTSTEQ
jgi:hypothetical protein